MNKEANAFFGKKTSYIILFAFLIVLFYSISIKDNGVFSEISKSEVLLDHKM